MMNLTKRLLEKLHLVRLVWFTHPFKGAAPEIVLRVVRFQGPRRQSWCQSASYWRAILLADGKCKGKFDCSWEPYNERSPLPGDTEHGSEQSEEDFDFSDSPPSTGAWAN